MYGKMRGKPEKMSYEINSIDKGALKGKATRKEISVVMKNKRTEVRMDILIYLPNFQPKPVANFIALNFYGNHSIHRDPNIALSTQWMPRRLLLTVVMLSLQYTVVISIRILMMGFKMGYIHYFIKKDKLSQMLMNGALLELGLGD